MAPHRNRHRRNRPGTSSTANESVVLVEDNALGDATNSPARTRNADGDFQIGYMTKAQQEERDRQFALRLQAEMEAENQPAVEPTLTPEQIAAILGDDAPEDELAGRRANPMANNVDRNRHRRNNGPRMQIPPATQQRNAPFHFGGLLDARMADGDSSEDSFGEDIDDEEDEEMEGQDPHSDDPLNNTYGRDSFVVSDEEGSDEEESDFSDNEFEPAEESDNEANQPDPENPLNSTAPADCLRSAEHGHCTICFEEMPYDPVGCVHCKQLIGCRRCVKHWWDSGVRIRERGGSPGGHAPHNHFQCPLCRHEWKHHPEVENMFQLDFV